MCGSYVCHVAYDNVVLCNVTLCSSVPLCNALQNTAKHCNTQQHAAARCRTLSLRATTRTCDVCGVLCDTAALCNALQHTATHTFSLGNVQIKTNPPSRGDYAKQNSRKEGFDLTAHTPPPPRVLPGIPVILNPLPSPSPPLFFLFHFLFLSFAPILLLCIFLLELGRGLGG